MTLARAFGSDGRYLSFAERISCLNVRHDKGSVLGYDSSASRTIKKVQNEHTALSVEVKIIVFTVMSFTGSPPFSMALGCRLIQADDTRGFGAQRQGEASMAPLLGGVI